MRARRSNPGEDDRERATRTPTIPSGLCALKICRYTYGVACFDESDQYRKG